MIFKINIAVYTFVLLALSSCSEKKEFRDGRSVELSEKKTFTNESLELKDFLKWCANEENGITKVNEVGELKYELMYMPAAGMACLELQGVVNDNAEMKKAMEHYSDLVYFKMKIEWPQGTHELLKYNLSSPQQYEWRVKYASYDMQNDLVAIQAGDTIYPALYHFERVFEAAPRLTVMIAFDKKKLKKSEAFTITFNDNLLDKGIINFNYKDDQLINIPNITGL